MQRLRHNLAVALDCDPLARQAQLGQQLSDAGTCRDGERFAIDDDLHGRILTSVAPERFQGLVDVAVCAGAGEYNL